jgi:hypothetical protein
MLQPDRSDGNVIRHMHFAYLIPKSTNTYLEYVIPICFPQQECFQERPTTLRYTYIAYLVIVKQICLRVTTFFCVSIPFNSGTTAKFGFDSRWWPWNFSLTKPGRPLAGPGVDSSSKRNEHQQYFLGVKATGA